MANIPKRFQNVEWQNVDKRVRDWFDKNEREKKLMERGLYIFGGFGTGKTYTLWAIKKMLAEKYPSVEKRTEDGKIYVRSELSLSIYNTTELLYSIRRGFDSDKNDYILDDIMTTQFLAFDDIGAEKITEWVQETFYLAINKRYEEMMPTFFASNFDIAELADRIGHRTASRIVEMCDVIQLGGGDRRFK